MDDDRAANGGTDGTEPDARPADEPRAVPSPGRSRLPWASRGDLDRSRSERDAARRALRATRAERDAAVESLARARAERDAALASLGFAREELDRSRDMLAEEHARAQREDELLRTTADMAREIRAIHALERSTDHRLRYLHRELMTDFQALQQLLARYSPHARLPPVAGWALSPSGLLTLVDIIESTGADTVVECGSGTSTLWIAYALQRVGRGRVISLEHLTQYAEQTRAVVSAHGLEDFVDVRLTPLAPRQTPRGEFAWYDFDVSDLPASVDVLVVDGPPQSTGRHARYPALSVFGPVLKPGAVIVADDTDRPDEREMLEFWLAEEPRLRPTGSPGPGIETFSFDA